MIGSGKKDKWFKYKFMRDSPQLRPYMPHTELFSLTALWDLLSDYGSAIAKPRDGSRGRGVFQIRKKGHGRYELHIEKKKMRMSAAEVNEYFQTRIANDGSYMVQRRIRRAKIRQRPFDLRVIVQKRKNSPKWMVTGEVAKLAGRGYIVSNITRSKGKLLPLRTAIKLSTIRNSSFRKIRANMRRIAVRSAIRLNSVFPDHRIYGLDVALDRRGRVWIIEANLYPAMSHFTKLRNKKMYRRIMSIKRHNNKMITAVNRFNKFIPFDRFTKAVPIGLFI